MAEDEIDEVPKLPPDARLESLDERLDRLQRRDAEKAAKAESDASSSAGRLVVSQLVGGPMGGAIVGWLLDRWFGTAPWLMLGLMFVGFAGGLISVVRISGKRAGANRPQE
jgi:ATP synthase protein I